MDMIRWFKHEMSKVSSRQWLFSLKTNVFCLIFAAVVFLALAIYFFVNYANNKIWWVGFIPLGVILFVCMIEIPAIFWLNRKYKEALKIEKEQTLEVN